LGGTFGPAGPLVLVALILEAHKAIPTKAKDFDCVPMRYAALARRAFLKDGDEARQIIAAAVEVGLLERVEDDGQRFVVRLVKWESWESKNPRDTLRKQAQRTGAATASSDWKPGDPIPWPDDPE
jgi:hypothetical protein